MSIPLAYASSTIDDILDSISPHADASAHTIDPLVHTAHRDLGAVARLAGGRAHLDNALGNLRDFLLEQALHKLRLGAAEDHLHAAARLADLVHRRPHPLVDVVRFAGDLFAAGKDGLNVWQRNGRRTAFVALDRAGDKLPARCVVLVEEVIALGLADLLDHHLLGRLRADPLVQFVGRHGDAVVRARYQSCARVDLDLDVLFLAVVLFSRGNDRRFDALEDDFLIDILIAVDCIHDAEQFAGIHRFAVSPAFILND